jgi:hypothetical protein
MTSKINRRELLKHAAAVGGLSTIAGRMWAAAEWPHGFPASAVAVLEHMTRLIIPTDATPGAAEARVIQTITSDLRSSPERRRLYAAGATLVNATSRRRFGRPFIALHPDDQHRVMQAIERSEFFQTLRRHTIASFYSTPVGSETTGFPGPGQPHGYADYCSRPASRSAHRSKGRRWGLRS